MSEKRIKNSVRSDLLKKSIQQESEELDREQGDIHPGVLAISGIMPAEIDAEAEHRDHLHRKHR